MFGSALKLIVADLTYCVFITVSCATVFCSSACFCCSSGFASSTFSSLFFSFSSLIHPLVVIVSTHAHPLIISVTFTSSSFFTSTISVALIDGTIFNLVFSDTI